MVVQRVLEDALDRLAGVLGDEAEHGLDRVPQVVGLDLDVDRAAADAGRAPVHEDPGVRQREPLALVPAESRNCPALQASPSARVETSHGTSRMTSRMASIEGTDPPGS